ncbi:MAG: hypothetical protein KF794_02750 [Xanthobacteraceae bacterium]|nr:hypothetical protein [Xanthobacteraceae bacterium]QYK45636.1 MAG: hypothetical protein KF794_02750 [Xanthobacteraceae bacterium]
MAKNEPETIAATANDVSTKPVIPRVRLNDWVPRVTTVTSFSSIFNPPFPREPNRYERSLNGEAWEGESSNSAVGYGKPPRHTQFKPGTSGNPKGRPKNVRNLRKAVEELFNGKVTVREGETTRKMSKLEAVFLRNLNNALKGDHRAIQAVTGIAKDLGLLNARPKQLSLSGLENLTDDELRLLEQLLTKVSGKWI